MQQEPTFEPITILQQKLAPQASALKRHGFYEFIFIRSGSGQHINHSVSHEFGQGDMFLVKPKEEHAFVIGEESEVFIARFSECTRLVLKELVDNSNGRAVALAKAKSPLNPKITLNEKDSKLVLQIFGVLQQLYEEPVRNESLFFYQLLCLITIVERNLVYPTGNNARPAAKRKDMSRILRHIHKYLQDPEMLVLSYIASKFNMSSNLLGIYFKKETGQSVKQYINGCRLKLIGEKVARTELTFSEISGGFGYVDESHFYKSFKKFYGQSPTEYREKQRLGIQDGNDYVFTALSDSVTLK